MGQPCQTYSVVFNINYSAQLTTILPAAIDDGGPVGRAWLVRCVVRTVGMLLNAGGRVDQLQVPDFHWNRTRSRNLVLPELTQGPA